MAPDAPGPEAAPWRVRWLALRDWRNIAAARVETDAHFVVIHGDNGQGKTNLLEAVWMLAALRPFRPVPPEALVREGAGEAELRAEVDGPAGRRRLGWRRARSGARRQELDGAPVRELGAWFDAVRAVAFRPDDTAVVRGGPAERRRFLDRAAFTLEPGHLDAVRAYRRALRQKAALLRAPRRPGPAELDAWDARLADAGGRVRAGRARALAALAGEVEAIHRALGGAGALGLALRAAGRGSTDPAECAAALAAQLAERRPAELERGRPLVGPHLDELCVTLEGRPARTHASQGQVRTIALALRLAELAAARARGRAPLFLLDDLGGELDAGRRARLADLLAGLPHQVWVTTTDPALVGPMAGGDAVLLAVRAGRVDPSIRP